MKAARRTQPSYWRGWMSWAAALYLSSVTLAELLFGMGDRLPVGAGGVDPNAGWPLVCSRIACLRSIPPPPALRRSGRYGPSRRISRPHGLMATSPPLRRLAVSLSPLATLRLSTIPILM